MTVPRFDLPFRYVAGKVKTVPQDTEQDILNCVENVVRTQKGQRIEIPDFGLKDYTLTRAPINEQEVLSAIQTWEPRAVAFLHQSVGLVDQLHTSLELDVSRGAIGNA